MKLILAAAFGGAIGSVCRYLMSTIPWPMLDFPWATWTVNLVGSFLAGLLWPRLPFLPEIYKTLLLTGFLGGFTTFSAYILDIQQILEKKNTFLFLFYSGGSVVLGILACSCGLYLSKALFQN